MDAPEGWTWQMIRIDKMEPAQVALDLASELEGVASDEVWVRQVGIILEALRALRR